MLILFTAVMILPMNFTGPLNTNGCVLSFFFFLPLTVSGWFTGGGAGCGGCGGASSSTARKNLDLL